MEVGNDQGSVRKTQVHLQYRVFRPCAIDLFPDPFALDEAAGRMVMFLNGMYHAGKWGKQYMEVTIEKLIRKK